MATSEEEIKKAVVVLLEQYGSLSTTEVKTLLNTVMPFDSDDQKQSATRNEPLIIQRIGNVVSHQQEKVKRYYDLYEIDKNSRPATWSILRGLKSSNTLSRISVNEVKNKKTSQKQFVPKKIDWESVNSSRSELGMLGEEFVVRHETNRVSAYAPDDLGRIIHLSVEQGDGAGFDILSVNDDGTTRYIEVKTTKSGLNMPFYMSENECQFFRQHQASGDAYIYRVYDFDETQRKGMVEVISASELFKNYNFDPISYKVTKK